MKTSFLDRLLLFYKGTVSFSLRSVFGSGCRFTPTCSEYSAMAIKKYGIREVKVIIKGPGAGRNAAVKGLDSAGLKITTLIDKTPIPHNGCRPRKSPRK